MKKIFLRLLCIICAAAGLVMVCAAALSEYYYKDTFSLGVWINGIYCTGMTSDEVSNILNGKYYENFDVLTVRTLSGEEHKLSLEDYGVSIDYTPVIEDLLKKNNGYSWILNGGMPRRYDALPKYSYDFDTMRARLGGLSWLNENLYTPDKTVSVIKTETSGYVLVDETKDLLMKDDAIDLICDKIAEKQERIDLSDAENRKLCYKSVEYTDEMKDILQKGIKDFQNFRMVYEFGSHQEVIDENVVSDWIALDENGNILYDDNDYPILDESLIDEYVSYLSATYDTVGTERSFNATRGDVVKVSGGSYGNKIDKKAESEFLKTAFANKESGTRIPQYISEAMEKGPDDIGDTYIEIDMGNQMMYYYKDGGLKVETPVVTGNMSRHWDTPSKVCYVYFKQKNRVLRGANYATPVKYWMAVDGHIGIHDASWRSEFGGDIYLTDGSHGCINTPLDIMSELYEMVDEGTPVIMFY